MSEPKATFGMYRSRKEIRKAVEVLKSAGFKDDDISILTTPNIGTKDFHYKGERRMVLTGFLIGAAVGAFILGGLGLLIGSGVLDIPGLNTASPGWRTLVLIAGFFGGIFFGGAAGALVGIGTPEPVDKRYASYLQEGGNLLSVHIKNSDDTVAAEHILERTGADEVHSLNEMKIWRTIAPEEDKKMNIEL